MEAFTQELARICNCQSNHDSVKIIFQARMVLNIVSFLPSRERERERFETEKILSEFYVGSTLIRI